MKNTRKKSKMLSPLFLLFIVFNGLAMLKVMASNNQDNVYKPLTDKKMFWLELVEYIVRGNSCFSVTRTCISIGEPLEAGLYAYNGKKYSEYNLPDLSVKNRDFRGTRGKKISLSIAKHDLESTKVSIVAKVAKVSEPFPVLVKNNIEIYSETSIESNNFRVKMNTIGANNINAIANV